MNELSEILLDSSSGEMHDEASLLMNDRHTKHPINKSLSISLKNSSNSKV